MHPGGLADVVLVPGWDVADPADRLVRDPQGGEDLLVELVLAEQQAADDPQELAGLRSLDDPVVVGGRERHRLADSQPGQGLGGRALVGGRVFHRADAYDAALSRHQPGHGLDGPDRPRVGQADGGASEVGDGELAASRLPHGVLVGQPELAEVHPLGRLDVRHKQLAGAVLLMHVDRQAQVDVLGLDQDGLAVNLSVGVVHLGRCRERPDDRVADEVGEGDLAAAAAGKVVVDHDPVVDEQLGGDGAHGRGRRHSEAGLHVGDRPGGGPAQPDLTGTVSLLGVGGLAIAREGPAGPGARGLAVRNLLAWPRCRRRCRASARPLNWGLALGRGLRPPRIDGLRPVVGEEIPPGPVDRAGIGLVLLVELIHQPLVGPEVRARRPLGART